MVVHVLVASRLIAERRHELLAVRELSGEEVSSLDTSLSFVSAFNRSYSLYEICIANYAELKNFYNTIQSSEGISVDSGHDMAVEINRLLLNYLSSFRTFIDHQETELSSISTSHIDWLAHFKRQASFHYDNQFSYRFLWNLRNYVQHCGLPLGGISMTRRINDDGTEEPIFSIYFNRDDLLNSYNGWKKIVRDELSNQPERIDVMGQVQTLHDCIEDLAETVHEIHIHRLSEYWEFLVGLVNAVLSQHPGAFPCIGRWSKDENGSKFLGLTQLPLPTIVKIQEIWKEFDKEYDDIGKDLT